MSEPKVSYPLPMGVGNCCLKFVCTSKSAIWKVFAYSVSGLHVLCLSVFLRQFAHSIFRGGGLLNANFLRWVGDLVVIGLWWVGVWLSQYAVGKDPGGEIYSNIFSIM